MTIILLSYCFFLWIHFWYIFNINLLSATYVIGIFLQTYICPLYLPMVFFSWFRKKKCLIMLPKVNILWMSQLSPSREFLGMVQRRETQAEAGSPPELRWQSWESRERRVSDREERHREKPPEMCSLCSGRIQLSTDQSRCGRKSSEAEKRTHLKDHSGQCPEPTQGRQRD